MHAALFAVSLLAVVQVAPPAPPDELTSRIAQLVRQLDDLDSIVQDAAEDELLKLGDAILPLLPPIDNNTPAVTKERLTRIRRTLEQRQTAAETRASRLTLKGAFQISEVWAEIEKQTGNRIIDFREGFGQPLREIGLELDLVDQPFWVAFDQILDQAGLSIYTAVGEPRALGVVASREGTVRRTGRGSTEGPFRLEITEIIARKNLRVDGDEYLRLRMEVLWEPRITPIVIRQAYADLELIDDQGNAIPVAMQEGTAELPVHSTVASVDVVLPALLPDRSVHSIAKLRGSLTAMVPGQEEVFEFEDLEQARNVVQQRGGLIVTLDRVRKNGSLYEFRIRLRIPDSAPVFESHLDWAANNSVYLVAPDGTRIGNPNYERFLEREREIGFAYLFPVTDLTGHRLVYESPAGIVNLPIRYELTDIELP